MKEMTEKAINDYRRSSMTKKKGPASAGDAVDEIMGGVNNFVGKMRRMSLANDAVNLMSECGGRGSYSFHKYMGGCIRGYRIPYPTCFSTSYPVSVIFLGPISLIPHFLAHIPYPISHIPPYPISTYFSGSSPISHMS